MTNSAALWQQLQQAELVSGDLPSARSEQQLAFFLRMLLGASGWLSAVFFTAFISAAFISVSSTISSIWMIGVMLCAFSIGISHLTRLPILAEQFVFACSIAGQAQIMFAVIESTGNQQLIAAALFILEIAIFFLIGIRNQRTIAVFIACGALLWLLGQQTWIYALPAISAAAGWLWLYRLRWYKHANYLQPATTGLTLVLWLTIVLVLLINSTELSWLGINQVNWRARMWITTVLTSLVCLVLAWQLIQQNVQHLQLRYLAIAISLGVALVNLKMLGLAPLCLLLCIGIAHAHKRIIWLNLCCLVGYLMLYYYSLNNSLLYKSVLLCVSGAVLLAFYVVLNRYAHKVTARTDDYA